MQSRQYIHAHRHASHQGAHQSFWRSLAILRGLGNGGQQLGLDEPEIDLGDPLDHAYVCVVRGTRVRGRLAGFQADIQRDGRVFHFTHASRRLV
jgi:hypothetical protein